MASQAMPILDQEQLLTRQIITAYHFVMVKRMVARLSWSRLSEQNLRVDKWSSAVIRPPRGSAEG